LQKADNLPCQGSREDEFIPSLSLVITAYNEELGISQKIENTLQLDYPEDKLEIIVVSDASTDRTDEIVRSYADRGIKLLRIPKRHGKHYGQGRGIKSASHDLIILSDATTFLHKDAVRKIARNFSDPTIGCISGCDMMKHQDSSSAGENHYVKYEMYLRQLETEAGSLVGVSGCFFAIRKTLCETWIDEMSSDFYLPIITRMRGYRAILENEAGCHYEVNDDSTREYTRKVRTIVHGLEVLFRFKKILNPFRYGFFSLQMISHKLSRWLVPLYLFLVFWTNLLLLNQGKFYVFTFILQLLFYSLFLVAILNNNIRRFIIFKVPFFFVLANHSIVMAWFYYLLRKEFVLWEPTKR